MEFKKSFGVQKLPEAIKENYGAINTTEEKNLLKCYGKLYYY